MLTDREKKYLKTEISNLRAKMMNTHNVELKGQISAQIQELKDTLEGKPSLWESSDEELNRLYEKLNRKDFLSLIGIESPLYYKNDYLKNKIYKILQSRKETKEREENRKKEVNSSVFTKADLEKHGIIEADNSSVSHQNEEDPEEEQRKEEIRKYVAALYYDYFKIASSFNKVKRIHDHYVVPALKRSSKPSDDDYYLNGYLYYIDRDSVYECFSYENRSCSALKRIASEADADKLISLNENSKPLLCKINMTFEEMADCFVNTAITKSNAQNYRDSEYATNSFYYILSDAFYNKHQPIPQIQEMIKEHYLNILSYRRSYYED